MDKKERGYIHTLVIYTLRYKFSNHFDDQNCFGKDFVTKKVVPVSHSYLKNALAFYAFNSNNTI